MTTITYLEDSLKEDVHGEYMLKRITFLKKRLFKLNENIKNEKLHKEYLDQIELEISAIQSSIHVIQTLWNRYQSNYPKNKFF